MTIDEYPPDQIAGIKQAAELLVRHLLEQNMERRLEELRLSALGDANKLKQIQTLADGLRRRGVPSDASFAVVADAPPELFAVGLIHAIRQVKFFAFDPKLRGDYKQDSALAYHVTKQRLHGNQASLFEEDTK